MKKVDFFNQIDKMELDHRQKRKTDAILVKSGHLARRQELRVVDWTPEIRV